MKVDGSEVLKGMLKNSKVVVKKFDNVKVDGQKLSVNTHPSFNYTFTLNALSVFTDRLLLSRKVVKF